MILPAQFVRSLIWGQGKLDFVRQSRWWKLGESSGVEGSEEASAAASTSWMTPWVVDTGKRPCNSKFNFSEIYFSFETIFGSFWSSKLKKKIKEICFCGVLIAKEFLDTAKQGRGV